MDRKLSLPICMSCGFINASRIRETHLSPYITLPRGDFVSLDILLSEFKIVDYKDNILNNFKTLKRDRVFEGYSIDEQIVATTYYTLQANNELVYVRKYCKFMGVNVKKVFNLSKKIAKYYGRHGVFIITDLDNYLADIDEEAKNKILHAFKEHDGTLTRAITAGIFYENSDLTQAKTCELFGISLPRLKRALKVIRKGE
tara:strand:+ start:17834 stop:18433 length:600 start_codon:yes stop_codon:yes gene_type:complete